MGSVTTKPPTFSSGPPDPGDIRRELALILESSAFRGSKRCQDFLTYVVDRVLEGRSDSLKERSLAVEVFGRKADADLGDDSIVRVGAREVRKRLAQYYLTAGANHRLWIELPAESYVPLFHPHGADIPLEVADALPGPGPAAPVRKPITRVWVWGLCAIGIPLTIIAAWFISHNRTAEFESFWGPVFDDRSPINIALAHPIVYHATRHAYQLDEQINGRTPSPLQRALKVPPQQLNGSDFVPVLDQYAGFGDTVAAARLFSLCALRGRSARMRFASKLDFADLRDCSTLLIGGPYTNRWSLELAQNFRYRMSTCGNEPCIIDATGDRRWILTGKTEDGRSTEDYILISRMPKSPTGGMMISGAGLTMAGTEEAGRILTDAGGLSSILHRLPSGWKSRNLQLVLHSKIVGDTPAAPEIIASHLW